MVGILKDNFKVKFCIEKIHTTSGTLNFAVPMVSFCDIPLSEIKNHISNYGKYGIGLKKDWGIQKGLNPVLYFESKSKIASAYRLALKEFLRGARGLRSLNESQLSLIDSIVLVCNEDGGE